MSCKYYNTETGICDLCPTPISCEKVFICSEDGIWVDTEDINQMEIQNGI